MTKELRERFEKYFERTILNDENALVFCEQEIIEAERRGYSEGHHQGYKEGAMERL